MMSDKERWMLSDKELRFRDLENQFRSWVSRYSVEQFEAEDMLRRLLRKVSKETYNE